MMRLPNAFSRTGVTGLIAFLVVAVTSVTAVAGELQWQMGTCTDAGVQRDVFVGSGGRGRTPFGPAAAIGKPATPEVATYVLETEDRRFEIKDITPIGAATLNIIPGDRVAFAVNKKTVYIRDSKGVQYRFRLVKSAPKVARQH
jgi:hypothetical protein